MSPSSYLARYRYDRQVERPDRLGSGPLSKLLLELALRAGFLPLLFAPVTDYAERITLPRMEAVRANRTTWHPMRVAKVMHSAGGRA